MSREKLCSVYSLILQMKSNACSGLDAVRIRNRVARCHINSTVTQGKALPAMFLMFPFKGREKGGGRKRKKKDKERQREISCSHCNQSVKVVWP